MLWVPKTVFRIVNVRKTASILLNSFQTASIAFWTNSVRNVSTMTQAHVKEICNDIEKSAPDERQYRGLVLNNGMKILLVSDPTTDKSSAAMDVNAGSLLDPRELPGLAHFCEHMLFLGTEKYPEENQYSKYLSEHGGSSNAFTSAEHTNFYFDVAPDHLEGSLDRFAQFFCSPLFTPSATEREVNAVNQENDKNLSNDTWRLFQLDKATCSPDHDYNKFSTGNKDTLEIIPKEKGINVRDELLKFHNKFYSANLMALSVLGKESLEELQEMVVPKFCDVENKNLTVPRWDDHPYGKDQLQVEIDVTPVKDIRSLNVTWPIPDLHPYYKSNPGHYLGHLIGHEGPGSLLSELKSRGWVNQLVGGQKYGARGFMFLIVNVDLTEDGIEHTDDIITLMFQYLAMLRREGPQDWIFQECKDLSAMQFRFKDKEKPRNYTCQTSSLMHDYPMAEILSAGYLLDEFDPDLVKMVMDCLVPEKIRVAVIAKKFEDSTDLTEKYYGTKYSIKKISEETLQNWKNCGFHDALQLPKKNDFIPTNFELMTREKEPSSLPTIIVDNPLLRLWYMQDDSFLLPKACISIEMTSPYAYMEPLSCNLTYMFVSLFRDALNEYAYDAELAGLVYDLGNTVYGLTLNVRGYHHKQPVFLKKILDKMTSFVINPQRFGVLLENYVRSLKNFRAEQPHQHAIYYTSVLMSEQMWTKEELLDATEDVTIEKLQSFITELLSRLYIEMLVYGNVDQERARKVAAVVQDTLTSQTKTRPLLASQRKRLREHQLPDGCYYLYKSTNDVHRSSSLEVYYQCSTQETRNNMLLELFCQIISEPCFDILRTQEQLGYIVFSGVRRSSGVQGLRVIVQSEKSPDFVEGRIEAFLEKVQTMLDEMDEESFKKHVEALASKRLEKPKKLSAQNATYWTEISSQQYNFDRDNVEVAFLRNISKEDLTNFYKNLIASDAPNRHKLSVHIVSTVTGDPNAPVPEEPMDGVIATDAKKAEKIEDVSAFKRSLGMFPLPKPFIDLKGAAVSKL